MSSPMSYDEFKKLYLQKIFAIEKNDKDFLIALETKYPELFDKHFLYQKLHQLLQMTQQELPEELEKILKAIVHTKKIH